MPKSKPPLRKGQSTRSTAGSATARPGTTKSAGAGKGASSRRLPSVIQRASTVSAISSGSRKSTAKPSLKRGASKTGNKLLKKDGKSKAAATEATLLARAESAENKAEVQREQLEHALMRMAELEEQLLRVDACREKEFNARTCAEDETEGLQTQITLLQADVAEARHEAAQNAEERDTAVAARAAMEKERDDALQQAKDALLHAEAMQAQCSMAQDANQKAQIIMEEATSRDQRREEEARKRRIAVERREQAAREAQDDARKEATEIQARADVERKALRAKLRAARDETVLVRDQLRARQEEVELLAEKLRQPRPALEQVRDEMREIIQHLLRALQEKVAERDALRGGESLRWKIIHTKMETLTDQIGRIFDIFASKVYEKEALIAGLQADLEKQHAAHAETKSQVVVVRSEQDMLKLLFHAEPNLFLRSGYHPRSGAARFGALVANGAPQRISNQRESARKGLPKAKGAMSAVGNARAGGVSDDMRAQDESPVPLRARLLLSATRADEVAKIIERNRTWNDECSTLLLTCCIACGAFFLDADMAWPCACASSHALTTEHEAYTVLASELYPSPATL